MLPSKRRIKKRKDFERVFKEGEVFFGKLFTMKVKKNDLSFFRFAFVFPLKQEKKAVKRNRGKRVMREAVKGFLPLLEGGFDIIFIIKKNLLEEDFQEIKKETEKIFKKAQLIQ